MNYVIRVLTSVLLGLNCSQLYVCCCSSVERGETAAAFIPLYKTSASNLGSEQHAGWPVSICWKAYFCSGGSEQGGDPMCNIKLWQKTWVENNQSVQAGGGDMQEVKDPCAASSSSSLQLSWAGRKGYPYLLLVLILPIQWLSGKSRYWAQISAASCTGLGKVQEVSNRRQCSLLTLMSAFLPLCVKSTA